MDKSKVLSQVQDLLKSIKANPEEVKKLNKEEKKKNPDEKQDADLGEKVEEIVEEHMLDNKDAEEKEGHKIMKKTPLEIAKELIAKYEADPKAFEELEKASSVPAPAPAAPKPAPKMAVPKAKPSPAPKAPAPMMAKADDDKTKHEQENKPTAMNKEEINQADVSQDNKPKTMSKDEIKADLKKEWKPKFRKEC